MTLDVGCGRNKHPAAIGIDRNRDTNADVICDLDRVPYPFREGAFDQIRLVHVFCDLRYFGDRTGGFGYYTRARMRELKVQLKLLRP